MSEDELFKALLELYPDNDLVKEFLMQVDEANEIAQTRIARSQHVATDETVEEEEAEEEAEEEEENADLVEGDQEAEEDSDVQIVLDEDFVTDLVRSDEFTNAMREVVDGIFAEFKAEMDERFRGLEERSVDVPTRTRRAVVSYRPREATQEAAPVNEGKRSFADIAAENVSDIFD
jgi:ABC-type proline/glycine betaine transport system ATPase subunit